MGDVSHEGRTVLFVSQNTSAIQALCPETIFLVKGQFINKGKTSEIVANYLHSFPKVNTTEEALKFLDHLPFDQNFQLLNVKIYQNESLLTTNEITNGVPTKVEIKYKVKKRTSNFRVYLDLVDSQGILLLKSFHDCDSSESTIAEPGIYISEVNIPSDFLAPKDYVFRIGATVFGDRQLAGQDGLCIDMSVRKTSRINRGYTLDVEVGKIAITI